MKKFLVAVFSAALLVLAAQASAKPNSNDTVHKAMVISSLPFSDSENTTGASAKQEPQPTDPGNCNGMGSTVWYAFTPSADTTLSADTIGSNYDTVLAVYTRTGNHFTEVACNDDISGSSNTQSQVTFPAAGGTSYYFQVGSCCTPTAPPLGSNFQLSFHLDVAT